MKCIKCGAYVYSSDKFCRSCGVTLNQDTCEYGDNISNSKYDSTSCHYKQYNYSYEYSNKEKPKYDMNATHEDQYSYSSSYSYDYSNYNYFNTPNDSGEDKYIKAYIGPNFDKIKKMKFSFPALIFGPWYLLYRKVWGYAIAAIIISLAATMLLEADTADIVSLIINIFLALKFQSIYMKQAEDHVENIKQQNLDKSTTELLNVCKKKGGTSTKGAVVAVFGIIAAYFVLVTLLIADGGFEELDSADPSNTVNTVEQAKIEQLGKLTYTLPDEFQVMYSSENARIYSYSNCNFRIEKHQPYGIHAEEDTYLNTISTEATHTINLNGRFWKYKQFNPSNFYQTVYAHKYQDALYIITLDNVNYYSCSKQYDNILPSIKFNYS